jgi:hypothetical protein
MEVVTCFNNCVIHNGSVPIFGLFNWPNSTENVIEANIQYAQKEVVLSVLKEASPLEV